MATTYSKARLAYALTVFREARKDKEPPTEKVQRHLRNDYQFRRVGAPSHLLPAGIWDDDDESSDEYNPESLKKRRPVTPRTPKPRRTKQGPVPANPTHTTVESIGAESGHVHVPSLVTLKFRSQHARNSLKELASQHGTGYENKDSDEDDESRAGGGKSGKTYLEKQNEESNKIGHGTTRSGLKRKLDDTDKIQGCTACKQANKSCTAKSSGRLSCKPCDVEGLKCVEYSRPGTLKDGEETTARNALAFTLTPHNSQSTSSPPPIGERPIDELRRHFLDVQAILQPGTSRQNPIFLASRSTTPEPPKLKKPFTFMISTPWAHPIDFKSKATECHFCLDFRYGIYGHYGNGPVRVEVSRMADGRMQEEANRHLSKGNVATRMCVLCSLRRLHISRCKVHVANQFGTFEATRGRRYKQQLVEKQPPYGPAIKQGVYYTCSLCAEPAFWRCVSNQTHDIRGCRLSEAQGKGRGCGLLLCNSCAGRLQGDNGVLKPTTVQKDTGHSFRRADKGFLFLGSLLHEDYM